MEHVTAIIVAGGNGVRLGSPVPKAFVDIAGNSMLRSSVHRLMATGIEHVVVVVPAGWLERAREEVGNGPRLVEGGVSRMASVAAGLSAVGDTDLVLVHDAVRPFVPEQTVVEVVRALDDPEVLAAAPGLPVGDTIKQVDGTDVEATVDRSMLVGIQTPQVFRRDVLESAHRHAAMAHQLSTDDLGLVERLLAKNLVAGRVVVTPGSALAFKVTHPDDLVMAASIARLQTAEASW